MEITPRHYATNVKKLSMGECLRLGGGFPKGIISWVFTRFAPPQGRDLMPLDPDDMDADLSDMSEFLRARMESVSGRFAARKYGVIGYQRLPSSNKETLDSGSAIFLSENRQIVGIYSAISRIMAPDSQIVFKEVISFNLYGMDGLSLSVANGNEFLDPYPGCKIVYRKGADVDALSMGIEKEKLKWKKPFRTFEGWNDVRQAIAEHDLKTFLHRRDERGLFIEIPEGD